MQELLQLKKELEAKLATLNEAIRLVEVATGTTPKTNAAQQVLPGIAPTPPVKHRTYGMQNTIKVILAGLPKDRKTGYTTNDIHAMLPDKYRHRPASSCGTALIRLSKEGLLRCVPGQGTGSRGANRYYKD